MTILRIPATKMGSVINIGKILLFLSLAMAPTASFRINTNYTENMETSRFQDKLVSILLPNNTIPRIYHITLEPDMDSEVLSWSGLCSINIEIMEPTTILTLHAYENLIIDENFTQLVDINGSKILPTVHTRNAETEFLKLQFDRELPSNNYTLNFKYEGVDSQNTAGFFTATAGHQSPSIAGTHFEATNARMAFPCWDEPALKAKYHLSIKHFPNYTAISNMPEENRTETQDGKILTTFGMTPIMSTYLLTFVISAYGSISNEYGNITVWGPKDRLEEFRHIVDFSQKVVDVMESYTGLAYGFPRLGSVVLPVFSSAATEHWGLITYDEKIVQLDETTVSTARKDSIYMLIAHELSHSWFGNRVTPFWWNDLWLNEAFAAYFQYYILDKIYEDWGGMDIFLLRNNQEFSFSVDTETSIPIRWLPVKDMDIRRMFGPITYRKGAAIVHMIRSFLTDDIFQSGIRKYLTKHSFQAVIADDLIYELQEAYDSKGKTQIPLNLKEIFNSWLMQSGYPILYVQRNYTTGQTELTQRSNHMFNSSSSKWWIPLSHTTKSNPNFSSAVPSVWFSDKEDKVVLNGIDKDDWIVFNIKASGYYRVIYDDENWYRLVHYLINDNHKNIHVLNRAQFIDDAFFLAHSETEPDFRIFYKLIKYLFKEADYAPWHVALRCIKSIESLLSGTEVYETFQKYIVGLMNSLIEAVGFEVRNNETHLTTLSRENIVSTACEWGHTGCVEFAARKLLEILENPADNKFDPSTKNWIICAGLQGLNETAAMNFAVWLYENDKTLLYKHLHCSKNHDIHRVYLNLTMVKNITESPYDLLTSLRELIYSSTENFNFAIDYFLENHQALNNFFNATRHFTAIDNYLYMIAYHIKTTYQLEKVKKLLEIEGITKNNTYRQSKILPLAMSNIAGSQQDINKYRLLWDNELPADNTILGSNVESR